MIKAKWRKVVFAIAIAILYIPMVFLGVNTFFPELDQENCYSRIPIKIVGCERDNLECLELEQAEREEQNQCYKDYQAARKVQDGQKYIILMIITLLTSLVLMTKLDHSIIYGLFFGIVITAFVGTIRYIDSKSPIGFFLMVTLFILIIVFVQKMRNTK